MRLRLELMHFQTPRAHFPTHRYIENSQVHAPYLWAYSFTNISNFNCLLMHSSILRVLIINPKMYFFQINLLKISDDRFRLYKCHLLVQVIITVLINKHQITYHKRMIRLLTSFDTLFKCPSGYASQFRELLEVCTVIPRLMRWMRYIKVEC